MKKILSIDGGGIRGIIPALILAQIEKRTKRKISEMFDLIAGTSTGGILALCLTKPDSKGNPQYSAEDIVKLYEDEGMNIFRKSPWKSVVPVMNMIESKYPKEGIEDVLQKYFGNTKLSSALTNVIIPSYDIERRKPFFFKSREKEEHKRKDFMMKHAARATSAAPTYFESAKIDLPKNEDYFLLIDGGVFANDPAMCAYAEAKKIFEKDEEFILVSLGTGKHTRKITKSETEDWGLVQWARPLLSVDFDGVSRAVEYQLKQLENSDASFKKYYRFQADLEEANDDMDDASKRNTRDLKLVAEEILDKQREELDELCKILSVKN